MTNEWALIHEMLHNHRDMLKAGGVGCVINIYTATYFIFTKQYGNFSLPTPQRHPRSFPGCPTRLHGWLGRSERGSGTARSPSPDRRLFSASCHSAALAQSGTGVSHSADKADKEKKTLKNITGHSIAAALCAYLQYPFQCIKIVLLTLQDRTQDASSHQL